MVVKAKAEITISDIIDGIDGKGITSTVITYQAGTSGTTAPTGTWSTSIPSVSPGQYLWNRTVIAYTEGDPSTTYSVSYIPKNGTDGATGATGTGIDSITQQYYLSTSKTTQTDGSWVTSMPTWSNGKYLWTRYLITYKNPTSTAYTSPICDSTWEAVNEIHVRMTNAETEIASNKEEITLRATKTEFDTLESRVSTTETELTQNANSITSIAVRMTNSERQISTLEQNADGFTVRLEEMESTVSTASSNAANALTASENAKKVATNYLKYDSSGLMVANQTETLGRNVLIGNSSIQMRNGDTILAEYGDSKISLGKNTSSVIEFCGGLGTILQKSESSETYMEIKSKKLYLDALEGKIVLNATTDVDTYVTMLLEDDYALITAKDGSRNSVVDISSGYLNISNVWGSDQCYINMSNFSGDMVIGATGKLTFNIDEPNSVGRNFVPYYDIGDVITIDNSPSGGGSPYAGYISSGGQSVRFTISLTKPILGFGSVSVSPIGGIRIRQNGKYLYGSGSAPWGVVSYYEAEVNEWGTAVAVEVTMANTTNAVNNSTCGVEVSLKLEIY